MEMIFEQLAEHGPWLLFLMAILETCFVTGLVVPSGVATSAATILALEAGLPIAPVIVAAAAGGFIGDSIGFWIGELFGERVLRPGSRSRAMLGPRFEEAQSIFRRHPIYSVTIARLISFVRTLMPMAAGMSSLSYTRYLSYEVIGVLGWVTIYVSFGFAGREGWEAATRMFGLGGTIVFAVGVLLLVVYVRRRGSSTPDPAAGSEDPDRVPASEG